MEYPSKAIQKAVEELASLPGVGKKTALRLALHILKRSEEEAESLGSSIISLRKDVKYCKVCHNISDEEICQICSNPRRSDEVICVVEDTKDVIAIESTAQFSGRYHVLGGLINPLQGVGPSQLNIESLLTRLREGKVKELIFAFSANIEGDTTTFYLSKKITPMGIKISSIARGIPVGADLEYTDEVTLARSILNRTQLTIASEE
ncbi:MAG: recombination mediator RecR [Bacteroidota bacterium]